MVKFFKFTKFEFMLKLPFSQQEHLKIFPTSLAKKNMRFPLISSYRDPKNIFYHQLDLENYMDQVLDFLLFDRHEYAHTESSGL